jgi:hypothetical protein
MAHALTHTLCRVATQAAGDCGVHFVGKGADSISWVGREAGLGGYVTERIGGWELCHEDGLRPMASGAVLSGRLRCPLASFAESHVKGSSADETRGQP